MNCFCEAETVHHIWLPPRLSANSCFLQRLLSSRNVSAGSRIKRTVSAGSHLSCTEVSAGSKRSRTVSAEAKYDVQSLQEAKIGGIDYTLCSLGWRSHAVLQIRWGFGLATQDPLYKGLPPLPPPPIERHDYEHRESPSKELPTKAHKQERLKERVELSQPLNFDKDHALKHRQVCTGTQTQISSVSPPNHYRTEESSSTESYSAYHHLLTQTVTSHQNLRNSSPQFAHSDLHNHHDAPLNLSLTNSSANSNSPSQSRPSVITCAPLVTNGRYENGSNGSPSPSSRREVNSADDQDIEEHFRRSLGKNYTEFLTKPASTPSPPQPAMLPSPPPPPPPPPPSLPPTLPPLPPYHSVVPTLITNNLPGGKENPNVSITGSVDDHFARALGNRTWSELKAKNDVEATQPGSVDDHFAKALGDTWLKIKAEKESSRPNHPFPISHQLPPHPHPIPHPIPHPHPHVLPLSQRSSPPTTQHSTSLLST